jgi:hypothetical protein
MESKSSRREAAQYVNKPWGQARLFTQGMYMGVLSELRKIPDNFVSYSYSEH